MQTQKQSSASIRSILGLASLVVQNATTFRAVEVDHVVHCVKAQQEAGIGQLQHGIFVLLSLRIPGVARPQFSVRADVANAICRI